MDKNISDNEKKVARQKLCNIPPVFLSDQELTISNEVYLLKELRGSYVEEQVQETPETSSRPQKVNNFFYNFFHWIGQAFVFIFVVIGGFLLSQKDHGARFYEYWFRGWGLDDSSQTPVYRYRLVLLSNHGIILTLPSNDKNLLEEISSKINEHFVSG